MLKRVRLKKYRCFENTVLALKKLTLIVGSNNAGKSSITEALRIIGLSIRKFKSTKYVSLPATLKLPLTIRGIELNLEDLRIDLRTIVYQYQDESPAEIVAFFDDKIRLHVYLTPFFVYAVLYADGKNITRKSEALKLKSLSLHVLPQLTLIQEDEKRISPDTVAKCIESRLSSRHFRNEIYQLKAQCFDIFRETAQRTWPGLRIQDISFDVTNNKISLMVFDSDFSAEIGLMGSGLQMWLQIIWFICRNNPEDIVVLDEPDVYMHPDLQRKLLDIVRNRFSQVIIATHSVEMMSDVDPDQIVTVDKHTRKTRYADSYEAVQKVINNLGSIHNLSLTRLGTAKKCIFVEGDDIKDLARFQRILFTDYNQSVDQLPTIKLGGWARFGEALGAARLFYQETHGDIKTYCILDRDFHTQTEINDLYEKAKENHLSLHVWNKKELENYIVKPSAIFRMLRLPQRQYEEFVQKMYEQLDSLYESTLASMMDHFQSLDRGKSSSYYMRLAKETLDPKWDTIEGRLSIANGKECVALINRWIHEEYGKSCSKIALMNALEPDDIDEEVKEVIELLLN